MPDLLLPFPVPLVPVCRVKSTLLLASVAAIRESGHFDAYYEHLDPKYDEEILGSVAGVWVSVDAAVAHYRACDALALTAAERMAIGRRTGQGLKRHLTHLAGVVCRSAGVSAWWWFERFNRFWARTFDGGGVSVLRLGCKEAEVVYAECILLHSPHFRGALRGVATGLLDAVTHHSFMTEAGTAKQGKARYRFSWV